MTVACDTMSYMTKSEREKLLEVLLEQHTRLKNDLSEIEKLVKGDGSAEKVLDIIDGFKEHLTMHLKLEDGTFYPEVIAHHEEMGADVEGIQKFMSEMMVIGEQVREFLGKYKSLEAIEERWSEFGSDFEIIKDVLMLRVTTEEEGVYMYLKV